MKMAVLNLKCRLFLENALSWKNIKITKKIGIGIGTIVFLLGVMSIISYFGVEGIVLDAREVIEGNKLTGILAQKEVDHLNWVADVSRFFCR